MATNTILYPNVTRIPGTGGVEQSSARPASEGPAIQKGEFDQSLNQALRAQTAPPQAPSVSGIKFSAHATQRLRERQINFDADTMTRMSEAINKADAKGLQDTLVLTRDAALIVNVPNRTVVTAMDREKLLGNVFTNIDGAVII